MSFDFIHDALNLAKIPHLSNLQINNIIIPIYIPEYKLCIVDYHNVNIIDSIKNKLNCDCYKINYNQSNSKNIIQIFEKINNKTIDNNK